MHVLHVCLCCAGSGICDELITSSEGSYCVCVYECVCMSVCVCVKLNTDMNNVRSSKSILLS